MASSPHYTKSGVVAAIVATAVVAMCIGWAAGGGSLVAAQGWQTLIAALIALLAATLAYRVGMAKINFDRNVAQETETRRRRRIAMHLDVAMVQLIDDASALPKSQRFVGDPPPIKDLRIDMPAELNEAWDNLEVFGEKVTLQIANLRYTFRELAILQKGEIPGRVRSQSWKKPSEHAQDNIGDVIQFARTIRKSLADDGMIPINP